MTLVDRVIEHEGFRARPYPDPLTGAEPYTFGHGLTWISEDESKRIVVERLAALRKDIIRAYPWVLYRPSELLDVLTEMSFQMGLSGMRNFRKMLSYAESGDYPKAAEEMLDSKWASQTPSRAEKLAGIVASL